MSGVTDELQLSDAAKLVELPAKNSLKAEVGLSRTHNPLFAHVKRPIEAAQESGRSHDKRLWVAV